MKSIQDDSQNKILSDKELIINWEFLWENKKKVLSKVIEIEEKIIELDIIEGRTKKIYMHLKMWGNWSERC